MRKRILLFAILAAVLGVLCVLFAGTTSNAPFTYDEADYMYAGAQGLAANYLDRNSMSLLTYIEKGRELARDKKLARSMSDYVRSTGDLDFYRHYHGPVYAFWIALWHDVGVRGSSTYRATGLIIHVLESFAIFWLFLLAFPGLPEASALIAALMFAMNRTALLTATIITQHLPYTFLACLALFAAALYLRTRETRYWYAAAALMGASFAAVEISAVLIAAVALSVILLDWSAGWKRILALFGKGAALFLLALALIWPPGVFDFNALKGYVYLAYMAIVRKTFTPISPRQLWVHKLTTYPLEFILPLAMAFVAWIYWRRLADRRAVTPFLLYGVLLFGATLVITIPNAYYLCSLMMTLAVVTGAVFGDLWKRTGPALRAASLVGVLASLTALDVGYYRETVRQQSAPPTLEAVTLEYLNAHPADDKRLVAPSTMVPTLHYYHPDSQIVSYDPEGDIATLSQAAGSLLPATILCPETACAQIETLWPPARLLGKERMQVQEDLAWYAIDIRGL